ncbi:MAG: hypothetical protein Q9184_000382 [Pyrenodesmia sp. 2 TL-2023]
MTTKTTKSNASSSTQQPKHPLKSHPNSLNLASMWTHAPSSSTTSPIKDPLGAHPNVLEFATKPVAKTTPYRSPRIRPIDSLPTNMSESEFERVILYDDGFWMTPDRDRENRLMDGGDGDGEEGGEGVDVAASGKEEKEGMKG